MNKLTNLNYKDSNFERAEELDAGVYQIQKILFDIKVKEAEECEDEDVTTIGEYIQKYPNIFISAGSKNDEILLTISEKEWKLTVESFEDYEDLVNEDIDKIIKRIVEYIQEQ